MDLEKLRDIGLSEGETKVYLALARLGSTRTGKLAVEASVSSSKVYKILDRLIAKGLAGFVMKGKTKYFSAMEPRRILDYIDLRQQELQKERTLATELIASLTAIKAVHPGPEATIFQGFKAVTNLYRSLIDELKHGESYCVIGASYGHGKIPGLREFFSAYHEERARRGIKVLMLANHDVKMQENTSLNGEVKYLPPGFATPLQILFYKNKVWIVLWTHEPTAIVITSDEAAAGFQSYFQSFWKKPVSRPIK
jgi:HTH-type transcriptional regulator, sugar sensing transcriptional regulator